MVAHRVWQSAVDTGEPGGEVGRIAAEDLVRSITGENDLRVLARTPGQRVDGQHRGIGGQLLAVPDEIRQDVEVGAFDLHRSVLGAEGACGGTGRRRLVVRALEE